MPRAESVHPDGFVIAFVCAVTLSAALLAGLFPALSATRSGILTALQGGSRATSAGAPRASLRKSLLTAEVALTVVLLMTAGLLFRSFLRLRSQDVDCATKNVLTLNFYPRGDKYSRPEQIINFDTQLLDKVRSMPGVQAAGLTNVVPGGGYYGDHEIWTPDQPPLPPGEHRFAAYRTADSPGARTQLCRQRAPRSRSCSDPQSGGGPALLPWPRSDWQTSARGVAHAHGRDL
jgi:putative ABC transport system permease protein